jgi:hypothetical protein
MGHFSWFEEIWLFRLWDNRSNLVLVLMPFFMSNRGRSDNGMVPLSQIV